MRLFGEVTFFSKPVAFSARSIVKHTRSNIAASALAMSAHVSTTVQPPAVAVHSAVAHTETVARSEYALSACATEARRRGTLWL